MSGQKIIDGLTEAIAGDITRVLMRAAVNPPIIDRSAVLPDGIVAYVNQETYDDRMAQLEELLRFVNDLRTLVGYQGTDLDGLMQAIKGGRAPICASERCGL